MNISELIAQYGEVRGREIVERCREVMKRLNKTDATNDAITVMEAAAYIEACSAERERMREALEAATDRCQLFLDTFGDVGDCVTSADIGDWCAALSERGTGEGE